MVRSFETNGAGGEAPCKPIEATEAYRNRYPVAYELSKLSFDTPRRLKVIVAGAGISGISFAHAVESGQLPNVDLQILEKNAGIGGTWLENRYPGCACDIPSHNYLFTWAPNPKWSSFYVSAPEILQYLEDVVEKFDLRKYITVSRKITGTRWNEATQKWVVISKSTDGRQTVISAKGVVDGEVGDEIVEECDVFINASGYMNNWRWPSIPGREDYEGILVHSANYDTSIDLRGKRVAVIGNGSSGIQVTAAVQRVASHVGAYLRSPTWVTNNLGSRFIGQGTSNLTYSEEQQKNWINNPEEYLRLRKEIEKELNFRFPMYIRDTEIQAQARNFTTKTMLSKLEAKPSIADLIIPTFGVGCRRPTPGPGYLEALAADNCEVIWGEIDSFTKSGLRSQDGTERQFDVIIAATGFDMSFVPRWPVIGRNGVNLQQQWERDPACYMSAIAQDMPNHFIYMGPGSPVGHGSMITSIERITLYIADIIRKLQRENYSSFRLKDGKAKAYQFQMLSWLEKTVWGDSCQSSFKNGNKNGALHAFHPGSRLHYFELLRRHRYEDFEWTSRCPESQLDFAWFNNGFLSHELSPEEGVDPTYVYPFAISLLVD
ncbi:steroid monooxygenase [Aspergillus eucalypticola CBS 122712]|uniref:Steroid monooxygenase n=1 Tax=Aspergillus eucalypticola (strain CBS 122712 / IBT 29274) TaxID=1448314 RepID=A0A317VDX4_ASPEC|nr:steroid monooxygenase [Aspergillus eucalypticola CBS 122712]PWY72573.1 steroid monooxygenase [Aspergillus eucalypticola CBS 122712]